MISLHPNFNEQSAHKCKKFVINLRKDGAAQLAVPDLFSI